MTYTPTDYLPYDFANRRHIGPSPAEMAQMLEIVAAESLEALIDDNGLDDGELGSRGHPVASSFRFSR